MIKMILMLLSIFLPSKIKVFLYNRFLGWELDATIKIGYSLLLCNKLVMERGAKIGNLTIVKGLSQLYIEENGSLGSLNWITGFPKVESKHFDMDLDRNPLLHIKKHAAITNRHLIDCTDSVIIGEYSTFAGFRNQILTHSINLKESRQRCKPVIIGSYCFVGTGCILLPGSSLPNYSILAAGSVLTGCASEEWCLYGGAPAKKLKNISPAEYKYMQRPVGYVW
jgi:acetyltransferase-like isoleucine patch superfamily enzyme